MKMDDLRRAADVSRGMVEAERQARELDEFVITGISLQRVGRTAGDPIKLCEGQSGTGSITGIGWPSDLAAALNVAMRKVFADRIEAGRAELKELGVEVEPAD